LLPSKFVRHLDPHNSVCYKPSSFYLRFEKKWE
jgi:hypothetical protein